MAHAGRAAALQKSDSTELWGFLGKIVQIAAGCGHGFIECGFLPPLQDFSRTKLLHDPMTDGRWMPAIHEDIGNVAADLQAGVRRVVGLANSGSGYQAQSPFPQIRGCVL